MVVSLRFNRRFEGRVFATGGPQTCFSLGDGRSRMQLTIPMDSSCGTEQEVRPVTLLGCGQDSTGFSSDRLRQLIIST